MFYQKEIDTDKYSVEQVYILASKLGKRLRGFLEWINQTKRFKLSDCTTKQTEKVIAEYNGGNVLEIYGIKKEKNDAILSETEKELIKLFRALSADKQKSFLDQIKELIK